MSKSKIEWIEFDEASVVGNVKGVQMPMGAKGKKKNPSQPYGEKEVYHEKVEKGPGGGWIAVNPLTGEKSSEMNSREQARAYALERGWSVKRKQGYDPEKAAAKPTKKPPAKQRKPRDTSFESLKAKLRLKKEQIRKKLSESSMISYIFENPQPPKQSLWETVVQKLPREVVMTDEGLGGILTSIAKAEARTLAKSVLEVKKVLESVGPFIVERQEADQDPDTGDVRMPFVVTVNLDEGSSQSMLFGVKLEGGKPLVLFPEESRNMLNNMVTRESKLLRAELMHVQETILDKINDVVEATAQRDSYLNEMHYRLNEMLGGMNLVEVMLMKGLVREKLKGVK